MLESRKVLLGPVQGHVSLQAHRAVSTGWVMIMGYVRAKSVGHPTVWVVQLQLSARVTFRIG